MSNVAFNIFGLDIYWYAIMIVSGMVLAMWVASVLLKRKGHNPNEVIDFAIVVLPLAIIGARLYYVLFTLDRNWTFMEILNIRGGGLAIYGGVIGGAIGVLLYCAWKKLSPLRWMDIIAPGLILAQAIGRWGNFFNQELYGYPTDLPWGIYIEPGNRIPGFETYTHFHPLFLYESLWNLLGFAILFFVNRKYGKKLLDGEVTIAYFMYYSVGRFILEGMKIDVWTIAGFPTARWISIITFIVCLGIIIYRRRKLRTIAQ